MQSINERNRSSSVNHKGYKETFPAFTSSEFSFIRNSINNQYENVIESTNLDKEIIDNHLIDEFNVSNYHKISQFVQHSKIWQKPSRCLGREFTDWFYNTSYILELKEEFGDIEITDEEGIGHPNIYWRLVRPNEESDIGSLHRDSWFWEIMEKEGKELSNYKRLKSWISINVDQGKNGLLVVPFSHKNKEVEWDTIGKHGRTKPRLRTQISQKEIILLNTENNSVVTFHDDLIHGGAINRGNSTRVSLEFTAFLKGK